MRISCPWLESSESNDVACPVAVDQSVRAADYGQAELVI